MRKLSLRRSPLRVRNWDWILVIGLMLAPMTGLRIAKVGPAEVLCLIWGIRNYKLSHFPVRNELFRFIVVYLLAMVAGTICGLYIAPQELVWSQWPTWPYLFFITYGIFLGARKNSREYNEHLMDVTFRMCVLWYALLYLYSITVSRTFLGAPLWFAGVRYTGGAKNPHQVAVLMCGITFWFMRQALRKKQIGLNLLMAFGAVFVEWQTAASTGTAALAAGILVLLFLIPARANISTGRKVIVFTIEILILAIIAAFVYKQVFDYLTNWILSDANGLGRINLISQLGDSFMQSPIFGMGPGVHAFDLAGNPKEFHNTYSEILAATGIVGMIAFVILTFKTLKYMMRDQYLIPIMAALYVYGLGGYAMRRLAYWGIFTFIFVIARQSYKEHLAAAEAEDEEAGDEETEEEETDPGLLTEPVMTNRNPV